MTGVVISLLEGGQTMAIGTECNNGNMNESGHVHVYTYSETEAARNQFGGDINGEAAIDSSGSSVSLSDDIQTVAIG